MSREKSEITLRREKSEAQGKAAERDVSARLSAMRPPSQTSMPAVIVPPAARLPRTASGCTAFGAPAQLRSEAEWQPTSDTIPAKRRESAAPANDTAAPPADLRRAS